jgi:ascorbate-specific PTS system EIIC-type component UlaA
VLTTAAGGAGPGTQVAATATVAAALTKAADAQKTVTAMPSPTRLAGTGIADEYGLPGMVVMALAFIIVILFARRLRTSPEMR